MVSVDHIFRVAQYGAKSVPLTATVNLPEHGSTAMGIAIYFHGGGYVVGSRAMLGAAHIEALTELGFVTVSSDYRIGPTISVLEGPVADSIDAYEWAQNELPQLLKKDHGVTVEGRNIVTLGHSCGGGIALLMASRPNPPKAVLDLFGFKYLRDPFFHTPQGPGGGDPPEEFANKVFEEHPPPVAAPPPFGPNGPDLSTPRSAFLVGSVKKGTLLDQMIAEHEYDQVDPAGLFKKPGFPPTCFIQGTEDKTLDVKITERAHAELQANGVETKLILVQGAPHGFDARLKRDDAAFGVIESGLRFLAEHV